MIEMSNATTATPHEILAISKFLFDTLSASLDSETNNSALS
jgi:hypothetical protein